MTLLVVNNKRHFHTFNLSEWHYATISEYVERRNDVKLKSSRSSKRMPTYKKTIRRSIIKCTDTHKSTLKYNQFTPHSHLIRCALRGGKVAGNLFLDLKSKKNEFK